MRLRTKLMKSLLFTTMILLFSTTLFGCEKTTNVNVNVKEKAEEMTKMETETMNDIQFMMEKYGLSEEEMQTVPHFFRGRREAGRRTHRYRPDSPVSECRNTGAEIFA